MTDLPFGPPPANQEQAVPLRRKLQILWQRALSKEVLAYAGVWRVMDAVPHTQALSATTWDVLGGYTVDRPDPPKKGSSDFATGRVSIEEDGVYSVSWTMVFQGLKNQYVDMGLRVGTTDPTLPSIRHEITKNKGYESVTYVTAVTVTGAPKDYYVVVKGESAFNLSFYMGGWELHRIDFAPAGAAGSSRIF